MTPYLGTLVWFAALLSAVAVVVFLSVSLMLAGLLWLAMVLWDWAGSVVRGE